MNSFSFVHAADLHLDAPFKGISRIDPELADHLRKSTFDAFSRIVDLCIENEVDFLVVAGDVYEGPTRNVATQRKFRDELRRLSKEGVKTFIVHGNHDHLDSWFATLEWPESVHFFECGGVEAVDIEKEGNLVATVYGISYPKRAVKTNLAKRFKVTGDAPFNIGVLHCNVGNVSEHEPYAPCSLKDLQEKGIDYWALGLIHKHQVLSDENPCVLKASTPTRLAHVAAI